MTIDDWRMLSEFKTFVSREMKKFAVGSYKSGFKSGWKHAGKNYKLEIEELQTEKRIRDLRWCHKPDKTLEPKHDAELQWEQIANERRKLYMLCSRIREGVL